MTNKDAQQVLDVLKEAQRIADTTDIPEADKAWRISAVLNGGIQPAQRLAEGESLKIVSAQCSCGKQMTITQNPLTPSEE